ncbi:hypothetical protein [uncultured Granulicatella sp.]|uniref:hypothetical protein n=1 Tax=uncultured Granulicatella sp. TaxID=316089 RepID=UPI0028D4B7BA|nr:hypothetical protein [uncultured Granulicatella sp.]
MASIAGENRDQGSIFSYETALAGCWQPRNQKVFFFFLLFGSKMYALSCKRTKKVLQNLDKSPISR